MCPCECRPCTLNYKSKLLSLAIPIYLYQGLCHHRLLSSRVYKLLLWSGLILLHHLGSTHAFQLLPPSEPRTKSQGPFEYPGQDFHHSYHHHHHHERLSTTTCYAAYNHGGRTARDLYTELQQERQKKQQQQRVEEEGNEEEYGTKAVAAAAAVGQSHRPLVPIYQYHRLMIACQQQQQADSTNKDKDFLLLKVFVALKVAGHPTDPFVWDLVFSPIRSTIPAKLSPEAVLEGAVETSDWRTALYALYAMEQMDRKRLTQVCRSVARVMVVCR